MKLCKKISEAVPSNHLPTQVNNRNTRKRYEIYSYVIDAVLVSLLLTLTNITSFSSDSIVALNR